VTQSFDDVLQNWFATHLDHWFGDFGREFAHARAAPCREHNGLVDPPHAGKHRLLICLGRHPARCFERSRVSASYMFAASCREHQAGSRCCPKLMITTKFSSAASRLARANWLV